MTHRPRRQRITQVSDRVSIVEDLPAKPRLRPDVAAAMAHDRARLRQAEEMIAHQRQLRDAQAAGADIVHSEAGTCISEAVGSRPKTWPEGRPVLRGGRWLP